MKKNIKIIIMAATLVPFLFSSCTKKLDILPQNDITAEQVYATPAGYKQALAKVYGSFALTGNSGPAGNGDIQGIDEGTSDFLRLYWKAQELSTDEAVVAWGDPGIQDFHNMNWSGNNPMLKGLYYRSYYQITLCNDFIRQSADDKIAARGITGADATNIKLYRAEARFLRAYQYSVLMDLFGNVPYVTEADAIGGAPPQRITRANLFNYVVSELNAVELELAAPKANEYGRADKAAAWALLARVYLNAAVYTGTAKYTEAIINAKKVIAAPYTLVSDYRWLMLADNQQNTNEFILTINFDGEKTRNWGGTTFLTHASIGGSMVASNYGVDGGWYGLRTTSAFVNKFADNSGATDKRAQFYSAGQNLNISSLTTFTDGWAITKFRNISRTGGAGKSLTWTDIDFPIFRLAEQYFIYAEAVLRGGTGGDATTALGYMNALRTRAYGNATGNISAGQLNLDYILDERARELYWEGFRRSDLVRYGLFTTSTYLWPWKGGVSGGTSISSNRNIFPIPSDDIVANPNLIQNPGY